MLLRVVHAGAHGVERPPGVAVPVPLAASGPDVDDRAAFVPKALEPGALVLETFRSQELRMRVPAARRGRFVPRALQLHEVLALQEPPLRSLGERTSVSATRCMPFELKR